MAPTLAFAKHLEALGKPVWLRFVLVPGLTDERANVEAIADFAASLTNIERVEVLPFHKMGEYKQLGWPYALKETPEPSAALLESTKNLFRARDPLAPRTLQPKTKHLGGNRCR